MDKKAYNLKRTFEQPIVFYEFTDKARWNKGLRMDWALTALCVELVLVILYFNGLRVVLSTLSGLTIIYFTIFPYYVTKYLVKLKQDGKKLIFFLWDFVVYLLNIQLRKVNYAYDEEIKYKDKKSIKFK